MPTVRMPNPATLVPEAMPALIGLTRAVNDAGLDPKLLALTHLRASQINGCGSSVAGAAQQLRHHGATEEQVSAVAAWRDTPWFTEGERAALALTEAVTRLADRADPVPDPVWDTAARHFAQKELAVLVLTVAVVNMFNRVNVPTRQQAGANH